MDFIDIIHDLDERIEAILSPGRALHSRRVAQLSSRICSLHELDPRQGYFAGLAHDICKELPRSEQYMLAQGFYRSHDWGKYEISFMSEHIPHGPAAAVWLLEHYEIADASILEAVAFHTIGDPEMGKLASIVYCADKIEPGRTEISDLYREHCISLPIMEMVASVCSHSIEWLHKTGRPVAPQTIILYNLVSNTVHRE